MTALFDTMATTWNDYYAADGHLCWRIDRFRKALAQCLPAPAVVLDFGCGTGQITRALAGEGWQVTGADVSQGMLREAQCADQSQRVTWVPLSEDPAAALPLEDQAFDAVISSSVFEYIERPDLTMAQLARVVKPGGRLLITVPDRRHRERKAERWRRPVTCVPPVRWLLGHTRWRDQARRIYASRNHWKLSRWCELMQTAGFRPQPIGPCEDRLALLEGCRSATDGPNPGRAQR